MTKYKEPVELKITPLNLGYLAGIIDGEGYISTKNGSHSPRITVNMTDLDVLEKLKQDTGFGNIVKLKRYANYKEHWKDSWIWTVNGTEAATILKAIKGLLSARRKEKTEEVLTIWQNRLDAISTQEDKAYEAAKFYIDEGRKSLRDTAKKYHCSYETIRRHVKLIDEEKSNSTVQK